VIKAFTVAEMALREVVRRRSVLAILLVLPLAFYLSRRGDHPGQSIRFLCLGLGWALSTAALFAGSAARSLEPRLRLSGYRPAHLWLGRLSALWSVGVVLAVPYYVLIRFDQPEVRQGPMALVLLLTVAIGAPFGLALSTVLHRELEGTLALLLVIGLQMMADPEGLVAHLLPFWSSRELGTYAVDHTDAGYLARGIAHGIAATLVLTLVVGVVATIRLRQRSHLRMVA
jgi:hypothetical protein